MGIAMRSPMQEHRSMRDSVAKRLVLVAALLAMVGTASLGVWQLRRAAHKEALAQAMRDRAAMPALVELPDIGSLRAMPQDTWHRRVTLRGRWMAQHTVYLDNRQMKDSGLMRVGFEVLTPLVLSDGTAIVVQRGWVPRDFVDRGALPVVVTPEGPVTVEGRYAPPPPRLYEFKQVDAPLTRVRQNLDVAAFAQEIGVVLRPGSLVQTGDDVAHPTVSHAATNPAVPPLAASEPTRAAERPTAVLRRAWTLPDTGVAKHHGYAFQWFALSVLVALLYAWFQIIRPRRAR
jgi:surfeit locus 1 family protein